VTGHAAEMNESVESDAFVIPSSIGCAVAGRAPACLNHALVLFEETELVRLLVDPNSLSPTSSIRTHRIICREMTSMCLLLMFRRRLRTPDPKPFT